MSEKNRHPGTSMDDLIPLLRDSTANLRSAASDALAEGMKWLEGVNHSRWKASKNATPIGTREEMLAKLKSELALYRSEGRHVLLGPFENAFDANGHLIFSKIGRLRYSTRDLFTTFLLSTHLTYFCGELIEFLELLMETEKASPGNKWNFPKKVAKAVKENAGDQGSGGNPIDLGRHDDRSEETLVEDKERNEKLKTVRKQRNWSEL